MGSSGKTDRHRTFLFIAIIFLWLAATAGLRRFTAPDEGRYAGVALEMLRSGDWLVPRLDGLPFFHKPPLFYWFGAAVIVGLRRFGMACALAVDARRDPGRRKQTRSLISAVR